MRRAVPLKDRTLTGWLASILFAVCFLILSSCGKEEEESSLSIRIGWQVPWATQGQVTQVLMRTNILELNGLKGEFKGFSYGGPLNEAALAGEVDVIFTADQPAAMLLAAGGDWLIIGRLMYNRTALYVPPGSPIVTLNDLKDKNVAMPFGAAAQRIALKAIESAGLDPEEDIHSIHLDIYEQAGIVQAGSEKSWKDIDALVGFDPTPAIFEYEGKARMLHVGKVVSLVLMDKNMLDENPVAPSRFLRAFRTAYLYYAHYTEKANEWFKEASRLDFDTVVLEIAASVEPNVWARKIDEVRIVLNETDIEVVQEAAEFIYVQNLINKRIDMREHIDMRYAERVTAEMNDEGCDINEVEVIEK